MTRVPTVRMCRYCSAFATSPPSSGTLCPRYRHPTAGAVAGPHSFVDVPLGPVRCPDCGWDDHGELYVEQDPVRALPHVFGDEGRPAPAMCPECEHDLEPVDVVPR